MKYKSVFDIIGPVMIGPSSSHTAGAARIGRVARSLFGREPKWAKISLYESFAKTYKGHGTDVAIIGGLLDFETDDERIIDAINIAEANGMKIEFIEESVSSDHPNTAKLNIGDDEGELELVGISIGGGTIEVTELNGFKFTGTNPAIHVAHNDRHGAIAAVANVLSSYEINIGHMYVSRTQKGETAQMTIEVDHHIDEGILEEIRQLPNITKVSRVVD